MRKIVQLTAIGLLILLTALAAATVQLYRRGRDQSNLLYAQGANQLDIRDSLRSASDALQKLQVYGANYVLTGRADSLKAYRESRQDWEYESGTLNLLSGDDATATLVHKFSETGNQLANEMEATVSLFDAGAHDTALDHLRTGAAISYRENFNAISYREKNSNERGGPEGV